MRFRGFRKAVGPNGRRQDTRQDCGVGDGGNLELAGRVRGEARDLDDGRIRQVALEALGPDAVEVVLLVDGEIARRRDQVLHRAGRGCKRLLEVLHREHGLLAHGPWQVE
jgi:hypothetical protein